jgi:hypothetical protein
MMTDDDASIRKNKKKGEDNSGLSLFSRIEGKE